MLVSPSGKGICTDCGFSAAGGADYGDVHSGFDFESEIIEDFHTRSCRIGKANLYVSNLGNCDIPCSNLITPRAFAIGFPTFH